MDWSQIIGQLGFPIASAAGLGLYLKYTQDKDREDRKEMHATNREDSNNMRRAIENNTRIMALMLAKLGLPGADDLSDTGVMRAVKREEDRQ